MRSYYLITLILFIAIRCAAQQQMDERTNPLPQRLYANDIYKRTDKGMYFKEDSGKTFYLSTDFTLFREYDKHHRLIQQGDASAARNTNRPARNGKWTFYYANGRKKMEGNFYNGKGLGTWKYYYHTGKLQKQCNYARVDDEDSYDDVFETVLSGSYMEYYPTGKLKTEGFYATRFKALHPDTTYVQDPASILTTVRTTPLRRRCYAVPDGIWKYYTPSGKLEKQIDQEYPQQELTRN